VNRGGRAAARKPFMTNDPRPRTFAARAVALAALLSALTFVAAARQDSPPARMMELNRGGDWREAARLAQEFLKSGAQKPAAQRCEAMSHLAYSQTRLGRTAEALETLASFDRECGSLPPDLGWVKRETARLRSELSGGSTPTAARPAPAPARRDDFWQTADPAALGLNVEALKRHAELCARTRRGGRS
jgi:hypothetical protein